VFTKTDELPTAFICGNDEEALALIRAAEARKIRIPQDISVIGYDNSPFARLERISLTTIDHPSFLMGEMATDTLLNRILHPDQHIVSQTVIRPSLVERDSVRSL
jgi:DNA-binding LacI/PurR family transcriptional regulator